MLRFVFRLLLLFGAAITAGSSGPFPAQAQSSLDVDLELVLAVDISYSMDPEELALQRAGYVEALRSPEIIKAIMGGPTGRIAVLYFEWAGTGEQRIVMPWTLINGRESAEEVAAKLQAAPIKRAYRTSIAGALDFAVPQFEDNVYKGLRRVIDISGDGPNNQGRPVTEARDDALAKGIAINGLPVMLKRPGSYDIENLDHYYADCVIGGQGAFVVPIRERHEFIDATRKKLLMEIAGYRAPARIVPTAAEIAQLIYERGKSDCLIGEGQWRDRWERN